MTRSQSPSSSLASEDATTTRDAAVGDLAQDPVDLGAGTDVDALGRLVSDEDLRLGEQGARQHHLLLVSTRQGRHVRIHRRRLHRQLRQLLAYGDRPRVCC